MSGTLFEFIHAYLLDNEPQVTPRGLAQAIKDAFGVAPKGTLVEADAFISHMVYRGSWPGERRDVEALIGRLRNASKA